MLNESDVSYIIDYVSKNKFILYNVNQQGFVIFKKSSDNYKALTAKSLFENVVRK
jgi:hypothetical protein